MTRQEKFLIGLLCATGTPPTLMAQSNDAGVTESPLPEITVSERRVANERPAGTFATPVTVLRYDPETELQSRGLAEGQADVTVRGGLFENTGFKIAAVSIIDPQTGHYASEIPFDPILLSSPEVRTGIDNAQSGFNSNIATIAYSIPAITKRGSALLGAGSDQLNFQSLQYASTANPADGAVVGMQLSAAMSSGDGSIANGDHDFERYNLHLQRIVNNNQSDLLLAYQDKFYGWPGAYTGFATLPETDHTKTTLVLASHRHELRRGWWQASAYYRGLEDDYDFNRTTQESGAPGSFDHATRVFGAGIEGMVPSGDWRWNYVAQLTADELLRSTDLVNGDFSSRSYASLRVVPEIDLASNSESQLTLRAGIVVDASNRDSNSVLPVLGITQRTATAWGSRFLQLEYAGTSQLPGYTALKSAPTGLFGGNPNLGREEAQELTLALGWEAADWQATATAFYRRDDDLVDWTFTSGAPFARQANTVDIDVSGVMLEFARSWQSLDMIAAYTWLDKDAEYGSTSIDASFYALNFARHRMTLALRYALSDRLQLRIDNEYRQQEKNALRASSDTAYLVSAALAWEPANGHGLGIALSADNLGDDDFQQFPGTPAVGRQFSLSLRYDW